MDNLCPVFTLAQAASHGWSKDQVYAAVRKGRFERAGRGVFLDPDAIDPNLAVLAAATALRPPATMCLTSALAFHGLNDEIPVSTDIALPRGTRIPPVEHATWHVFAVKTFSVGRETVSVEGMRLGIYSAERTIVDQVRLAYREGIDQALEALKRWLREPGHSPSTLLDTARHFPRSEAWIRHALEVLL